MHFFLASRKYMYYNDLCQQLFEFMVAFRTAVNALNFAIEFQIDTGDERVRIRAGLHIGPVIVEEGDGQGVAVNYAARVICMAVNGGVWLSNETKNHIDQEKA